MKDSLNECGDNFFPALGMYKGIASEYVFVAKEELPRRISNLHDKIMKDLE